MNLESQSGQVFPRISDRPAFWRPGFGSDKFSLLAACAGFLFSTRVAFALISARGLNMGSEAGVVAGFLSAVLIGVAALMNAFGRDSHPVSLALKSGLLRWVLLYLAFSGCSLLWSASTSAGSSAVYWGALVCDVGTVVVLVRASGSVSTAHCLLKGFIAGTCVLAAVAWMMPATPDLRLGDADYFNTNQIANVCAFSVLMCSLLSSRGDRMVRVIPWFLTITLFRSLSKATLIAFGASILYRLLRDSSMSRGRKWSLAAATVVLALVFSSLIGAYYDVYTTEGNQAETLTGRTAIWAWTLDASLSRPWFGNGFDAMWKVAPPFGGSLFEARHAENELLQQFFAYGACGIVLLAGIYGSFYRGVRALPRGAERSALMAFLIFVLVRGLAEAEPFDLLLPLWLVTTFAFLVGGATQPEKSFTILDAREQDLGGLPVC